VPEVEGDPSKLHRKGRGCNFSVTLPPHSTPGISDVTIPVSACCVRVLNNTLPGAAAARHRRRAGISRQMAHAALALGALLLAGAAPRALTAQRPGPLAATFQGRVYDAVTGTPLVGATITATSAGLSTRTDSLGRFQLTGLPAGIVRLLVTAPGYQRGPLTLPLAPREVLERELELEPLGATPAAADSGPRAQRLATVPVTAMPGMGNRFLDFERRRATGRGQYRTREEIETGQFNSLQDVLRTLRGVQMVCSGGYCQAQMVRATLGCPPQYIIDEREDNDFGPVVPVRDIQGIEVYTGAGDVPGEFAGSTAACGVIVVWTTNGRAPRRK
jgi:hypothetical protein